MIGVYSYLPKAPLQITAKKSVKQLRLCILSTICLYDLYILYFQCLLYGIGTYTLSEPSRLQN